MKEKQTKSVIECLPEDASLEQVIAAVNQIIKGFDDLLNTEYIANEAVKAIQAKMDNAASRLGVSRNKGWLNSEF